MIKNNTKLRRRTIESRVNMFFHSTSDKVDDDDTDTHLFVSKYDNSDRQYTCVRACVDTDLDQQRMYLKKKTKL